MSNTSTFAAAKEGFSKTMSAKANKGGNKQFADTLAQTEKTLKHTEGFVTLVDPNKDNDPFLSLKSKAQKCIEHMKITRSEAAVMSVLRQDDSTMDAEEKQSWLASIDTELSGFVGVGFSADAVLKPILEHAMTKTAKRVVAC